MFVDGIHVTHSWEDIGGCLEAASMKDGCLPVCLQEAASMKDGRLPAGRCFPLDIILYTKTSHEQLPLWLQITS